jgi:MarR family transcriptional regulator for hemolysin
MSMLAEVDHLFLLYDVARLMRTRADQRARLDGMTRAQWVILIWLERQPGLSQNELACLVEVEPITVARLIDRLEARGFVERRPDPKDRRIRRLHLKAAVEPLLEKIHAYRREANAATTEGIDPAALKNLAESLARMKANLVNQVRDTAKAG